MNSLRSLITPVGVGLVLFSFVGMASAQTSVELLIRPFEKDRPIEATADAVVVFDGKTDNADADYSMQIFDVRGRWRINPSMRIDPRIGVDATLINLDTRDPLLPDTLMDTSVAVGFGILAADGWLGGLTLGAGYSGVAGESFGDSNGWYGKASLAFGKKLSKTDTLGIVIDYDGNRSFLPDVPLPGFAYQKILVEGRGKDSEPTLSLTVGVPFTRIDWRPNDRWYFSLTYMIPDEFAARAEYDLLGNDTLAVFAALDARRDAFHAENLPRGDDRILFFQRRAEAGLRWRPHTGMDLFVAGGYAFSQEFTVGFDSRDDTGLADLSDEIYVRLGLEMKL